MASIFLGNPVHGFPDMTVQFDPEMCFTKEVLTTIGSAVANVKFWDLKLLMLHEDIKYDISF